MKKSIIALAIFAAFAGVSSAQAGVATLTEGSESASVHFTDKGSYDLDAFAADTQDNYRDINNLKADKLNISTYNADRAVQTEMDADQNTKVGRLSDDVIQNTDSIGVLDTAVVATAQSVADNEANINTNKAAIAANTAGIQSAKDDASQASKSASTAQHSAQAAQNSADIAEKDATGAKSAADRAVSLSNGLSTRVDQAQSTGEFAQSRADAAFANAAANKQALAATNQRVAADDAALANHETRIQTLESQTAGNFAKLKSQVDENRKRASAGISGVAAMANIPQVTNTQNFSVGAGVGTADSESALAVGFSARATENTVVKASVSDDSQHNFVAGAGVSYGW